MTCSLEYHSFVRHSKSAPLALLCLLALPLIFVSASQAQINGTPASVTSPGFGGRAINGTPPSVTSLGPRGFAPNSRATFNTFNGPHVGGGHHHRRTEFTPPPVVYAVPVPYAVDMNAPYDMEDPGADDQDANYQGGPTIFDRRGAGADSYIPPVRNTPVSRPLAQEADADPANAADPEPAQAPTLIVFKDGRKLELGNYAIVGVTLFDLTPGHSRRVALADLDLEATRKQNDERGVTFQLPPHSQAN
jgi:hypothetical protein